MKKIIAVIIAIMMTLTLLTACGGGTATTEAEFKINIAPYDSYDFDEYVKLPDYASYELEVEEVNVTDEDVDTEIDNRLAAASTETEQITEGTVDKGDEVTISFKGTLEDGSSPEGMNSDSYTLTLGEASMIDGFQEGLYGATIGEPVVLDLQFPDPYTVNEELSGKPVTFEITVLSKTQPIEVKFDEEFIKSDSEDKAATEEEYREYIKQYLQDTKEDEAFYEAKTKVYEKITEEAEILKYPDEEVEANKDKLRTQYQSYAEAQSMEWEDFVKETFESEENFETALDEYVKESVGRKLVIYDLCKKEGITVTDQEYTDRVHEYLTAFGYDNAEAFQTQTGMSIEDYLTMYEVALNMHLDKFLDKVYGTEPAAKE